MYFGTRSDHNKAREDLCKNRKIDETQNQSWRKQGPTTTLLASRCVENGIYWRATMLPHQIFLSSDGHGNWYTIGRISASDPILPYLISDSDTSVIPHGSNGRFYVKLLSRRSSQPWFLLFVLAFFLSIFWQQPWWSFPRSLQLRLQLQSSSPLWNSEGNSSDKGLRSWYMGYFA